MEEPLWRVALLQDAVEHDGDALAEWTHPIGGGAPTTSIPSSSTVATLVDVVLPRSAGRSVPKQVSSRIAYAIPPGSPSEAIIGSEVVRGPEMRVERRAHHRDGDAPGSPADRRPPGA